MDAVSTADNPAEGFDLLVPTPSSGGNRTWRSVPYYISRSNRLLKYPTEVFMSTEKCVLEESGHWYPITLIGPPMTGKQTWIDGVCGCWLKNHPRQKSMIVTAEDFHRDHRSAILARTVAEFQDRFRSLNFLCITGLQFLLKYPDTQRELVYILDQLATRSVPVLFTANEDDCIVGWYSPLFTRIQGGVLIKTQPPDDALREKYAREQLESLGFAKADIPFVTEWLVTRGHTSITALRAEILRLQLGYVQTHREKTALTEENAVDPLNSESQSGLSFSVLKEWAEQSSSDETSLELRDIVKQTAREFGLTLKELCGQSRRKTNVTARGVVVHLGRKLGGFTYEQIGRQLDGRDHTTISHAARVFEQKIERDPEIGRRILKIERALK